MGQPAVIVPEAYGDRRYEGRLEEIAPEANRQKATVQVKVKVLAPDSHLRPEMNAKVTFLKDQTTFSVVAPSKIIIPRQAVTDRNGKQTVFLIKDGKASAREVRVGPGNETTIEVTSGLSVGDTVIVSEIEKITDGLAVRAK
jgi:HlyD family secretion protein